MISVEKPVDNLPRCSRPFGIRTEVFTIATPLIENVPDAMYTPCIKLFAEASRAALLEARERHHLPKMDY